MFILLNKSKILGSIIFDILIISEDAYKLVIVVFVHHGTLNDIIDWIAKQVRLHRQQFDYDGEASLEEARLY